jgi:hypothetical protein
VRRMADLIGSRVRVRQMMNKCIPDGKASPSFMETT